MAKGKGQPSKGKRELVFTVGRDQFDIDTFHAGGPGGQHQNKSSTAVRITHRPSGAVGVARDDRSQLLNKKAAFRRCV